jgi:hypothetical protein
MQQHSESGLLLGIDCGSAAANKFLFALIYNNYRIGLDRSSPGY